MSDFLSFVGDQLSNTWDFLSANNGQNALSLAKDAATAFGSSSAKAATVSQQGILNAAVDRAINARGNGRPDDNFHSTQVASKRPAPVIGERDLDKPVFQGHTNDPWMSSMRYILNMNKNIDSTGR